MDLEPFSRIHIVKFKDFKKKNKFLNSICLQYFLFEFKITFSLKIILNSKNMRSAKGQEQYGVS